MENLKPTGVKLVSSKLIEEEESKNGLIRHSYHRVARAIYYWYRRQLKDKKRNK